MDYNDAFLKELQENNRLLKELIESNKRNTTNIMENANRLWLKLWDLLTTRL
jgi:hypothetical protein